MSLKCPERARDPETADARRVVPPRQISGYPGGVQADVPVSYQGLGAAKAQPSATHTNASCTPEHAPEVHATPRPRQAEGAGTVAQHMARSMGGEEPSMSSRQAGRRGGTAPSPRRSGFLRQRERPSSRRERPSSRRPLRRRWKRARASTGSGPAAATPCRQTREVPGISRTRS